MLQRFSRILVVDDSATVRTAVRLMFQELGHVNVDEAGDGVEALAKLERCSYALIVSDWFMEPMSGLELLMKVRRSDRLMSIPFIMITSRQQKKFLEVARDAGATHYLAKPFTVDDLGAKIRSLGAGAETKPFEGVFGGGRRLAG